MASALQGLAHAPQFHPFSILRALWKRKLLLAALALLGSGATAVFVSRLQNIYIASATILVESQKIPEAFVAATVQTALEARLDMLKEQVLSHERLWDLITALNLYHNEKEQLTKEELIGLMRRDIQITLVRGWSTRGPGAFRIEYRALQPALAAEVTNRVGMFFIDENLRQRTVEAQGTSEFLERQLAEAEKRLREQEGKLKDFKLTHNGELPQQEAALLAGMNQGRAELLGIQDALGRGQQSKLILEGSLAYAEGNLRDRLASRRQAARRVGTDLIASDQPLAPSELEQAQSQLRALRARYRDSHPEVQRMVQEVARLEHEAAQRAAAASRPAPTRAGAQPEQSANPGSAGTELQQEEVRAENNRIQELRSQITLVTQDLEMLETRRKRVLEEVAQDQRRLQNIPVHEQQLAAVTRDYETCKANYSTLLNKKLAADVATDMERWQKSQKFVMLDAAQVPQKPSRPRRTFLTIVGSLVSFAAAAALAFLLELRTNTLLGDWELPAGTCILGSIPKLKIEEV